MPDIPSNFQKDPSITFRVILLTHRQTNKQTDRQTKTGNNITSLAEVTMTVHQHRHMSISSSIQMVPNWGWVCSLESSSR